MSRKATYQFLTSTHIYMSCMLRHTNYTQQFFFFLSPYTAKYWHWRHLIPWSPENMTVEQMQVYEEITEHGDLLNKGGSYRNSEAFYWVTHKYWGVPAKMQIRFKCQKIGKTNRWGVGRVWWKGRVRWDLEWINWSELFGDLGFSYRLCEPEECFTSPSILCQNQGCSHMHSL